MGTSAAFLWSVWMCECQPRALESGRLRGRRLWKL